MENNTPGVNTPMPPKNHLKEFIFAIIVLIVAFGAGAMIYQKAKDAHLGDQATIEAQSNDAVADQIQTQSASDDTVSIKADLDATDPNAIDQQ